MDLTPEEFKAKYLSSRVHNTKKKTSRVSQLPICQLLLIGEPITPVKARAMWILLGLWNHWIFGTISFISGKGLQSFSEQLLVDCSTSEGNQECNCGLHEYAFAHVESNGITTESAYPYEGVEGSC